jgi:hypothetical protein
MDRGLVVAVETCPWTIPRDSWLNSHLAQPERRSTRCIRVVSTSRDDPPCEYMPLLELEARLGSGRPSSRSKVAQDALSHLADARCFSGHYDDRCADAALLSDAVGETNLVPVAVGVARGIHRNGQLTLALIHVHSTRSDIRSRSAGSPQETAAGLRSPAVPQSRALLLQAAHGFVAFRIVPSRVVAELPF